MENSRGKSSSLIAALGLLLVTLAVVLNGGITGLVILQQNLTITGSATINLSEYSNATEFLLPPNDDIPLGLEGHILTITPNQTGQYLIEVIANDNSTVQTLQLAINVKEPKVPLPEFVTQTRNSSFEARFTEHSADDEFTVEFSHNSEEAQSIWAENATLSKAILHPQETAQLTIPLNTIALLHVGTEGPEYVISTAGMEPANQSLINLRTQVQTPKKLETVNTEKAEPVAKKIEEDHNFDTHFLEVVKGNDTLTVKFYHDGVLAQPVWIEGEIAYNLSTETAQPHENITLTVPLVKGKVPKFKLHVGAESEVFEFGITVINIHSHPEVGGEWKVDFTTEGVADLVVTGTYDPEYTNSTTYWTNHSEDASKYDLKLLDIKCNGTSMDYEWQGAQCDQNECSAIVRDYSCDSTGSLTSKVLTPEKHVLRFEFGDDNKTAVQYAYNQVIISSCTNITTPGDYFVQSNLAGGNICLAINVSNVFLDCNAKEVRASEAAILINSTQHIRNITTHNCTDIQAGTGLWVRNASKVLLNITRKIQNGFKTDNNTALRIADSQNITIRQFFLRAAGSQTNQNSSNNKGIQIIRSHNITTDANRDSSKFANNNNIIDFGTSARENINSIGIEIINSTNVSIKNVNFFDFAYSFKGLSQSDETTRNTTGILLQGSTGAFLSDLNFTFQDDRGTTGSAIILSSSNDTQIGNEFGTQFPIYMDITADTIVTVSKRPEVAILDSRNTKGFRFIFEEGERFDFESPRGVKIASVGSSEVSALGEPPGTGPLDAFINLTATPTTTSLLLDLSFDSSEIWDERVAAETIRLYRHAAGAWSDAAFFQGTQDLSVPPQAGSTSSVTVNITTFSPFGIFGDGPLDVFNITYCPATVGATISTSGRYELTTNLSSHSDCIGVSASHVLIEGNNHNITFAKGSQGKAIFGGSNLTVQNILLFSNPGSVTSDSPRFTAGIETGSSKLRNITLRLLNKYAGTGVNIRSQSFGASTVENVSLTLNTEEGGKGVVLNSTSLTDVLRDSIVNVTVRGASRDTNAIEAKRASIQSTTIPVDHQFGSGTVIGVAGTTSTTLQDSTLNMSAGTANDRGVARVGTVRRNTIDLDGAGAAISNSLPGSPTEIAASITNNTILADGSVRGILATGTSESVNVFNNTIRIVTTQSAISLSGGNKQVIQNTITGNSSTTAISANNVRGGTIRGNNITVQGGTAVSMLLTKQGATTNITHNIIEAISADAIVLNQTNNTFVYRNNITRAANAFRIIGGGSATAETNRIENNTLGTVTGLGLVTSFTIDRNRFVDQTIGAFSIGEPGGSIIFDKTNRGVLQFDGRVNGSGSSLENVLQIGLNRIFVNITALPGFNRSATLTFKNLTSLRGVPSVDLEDDGTFKDCTPSTNPSCTSLDNSGSTQSFTATHFTTYRIRDLTIRNCTNITLPGDYILGNPINSTGTCLIINTSNVNISCNTHNITYGKGATGIGVNVTGTPSVSDVIIQDCTIAKSGTIGDNNWAILFQNTFSSIARRNTLLPNGQNNNYGILLLNPSTSAASNTLRENTINTFGNSNNDGIVLNASTNTIFAGSIRANGTGTGNDGIVILGTSQTGFNRIQGPFIWTDGGNSAGIIINSSKNTTITTGFSSPQIRPEGPGIIIQDSANWSIFQAVIRGTNGLEILGRSGFGRIRQSTLTAVTNDAIVLRNRGNDYPKNTTIDSNTISSIGALHFNQSRSVNGTLLLDQSIGAYKFNNSIITKRDTNEGSVTFILGSGAGTSLDSDVDLTFRKLFVNSTNQPGLNVTGIIDFVNLPFSENWRAQVDTDDDGVFINCNSTSDPKCTELAETSNSLKFNTTHFTTFRPLAKEELDACGQITSPGRYRLITNITSPGTCIGINASDVNFTCRGNRIIFGLAEPAFSIGINISTEGLDNLTIRDCIILKNSTLGDAIGVKSGNITQFRTLNNTVNITSGFFIGISIGTGYLAGSPLQLPNSSQITSRLNDIIYIPNIGIGFRTGILLSNVTTATASNNNIQSTVGLTGISAQETTGITANSNTLNNARLKVEESSQPTVNSNTINTTKTGGMLINRSTGVQARNNKITSNYTEPGLWVLLSSLIFSGNITTQGQQQAVSSTQSTLHLNDTTINASNRSINAHGGSTNLTTVTINSGADVSIMLFQNETVIIEGLTATGQSTTLETVNTTINSTGITATTSASNQPAFSIQQSGIDLTTTTITSTGDNTTAIEAADSTITTASTTLNTASSNNPAIELTNTPLKIITATIDSTGENLSVLKLFNSTLNATGLTIRANEQNTTGITAYNSTGASIEESTINVSSRHLEFIGNSTAKNTGKNVSMSGIATLDFTAFRGTTIKAREPVFGEPLFYNALNKTFNITNTTSGSWLLLNVSYTDTELANANISPESTLRFWKYDTIVNTWRNTGFFTLNAVNTAINKVFTNITDFSIFAIFGEAPATEIAACRNITETGKYELAQGLESNGTCITINASNVALDCKDFNITFGLLGENYAKGIQISTEDLSTGTSAIGPEIQNITVSNCKIFHPVAAGSGIDGIIARNTTNVQLLNNTIDMKVGSGTSGISSSYSDEFLANRNEIVINGTVSPSLKGILTESALDSDIQNNNITLAAPGAGIYISRAHNSTVQANRISTLQYSTVGGTKAISVEQSQNSTVQSNIIRMLKGRANSGIQVRINSHGTTVRDNDVLINSTNGGQFGLQAESASDNTFLNNTILVHTPNSATISLRTGSNNNTFIDNRVRAFQDSSADWRQQAVDFGTHVRDRAINLTFLRTNASMTFTSTNGTRIKALLPSEVPPLEPGQTGVNRFFNITGLTETSNLFVNISYDESDIGAGNESRIRLWKYDTPQQKWVFSGFSNINELNATLNFVTANITTFSYFGLLSSEFPPEITFIELNSTTTPANTTNSNLTLNLSGRDLDGDSFTNITTWIVDDEPLIVLNMPFETESSNNTFAKDYSGNNNHGRVIGAIINSTAGFNNFGAYEFNGSHRIEVDDSDSLDITDEITIMMWVQDPVSGLGNNLEITEVSSSYDSFGCDSVLSGSSFSGDDDAVRGPFNLGFDFQFFNQTIADTDDVFMDTNGRIMFDSDGSDFSPSDSEMQNEGVRIIAALWEDYGSSSFNNEFVCVNQGTAPNRFAVFRWDSEWYSEDGNIQSEVVLFENGSMLIRFGTVQDASSDDQTIFGVSLGNGNDYNYTNYFPGSGPFPSDLDSKAFKFEFASPTPPAAEGRTLLDKPGSYTLQMRNMTVLGFLNNQENNNVSVDITKNYTHIALSYNGSLLQLFKNGALADSIPYSQSIAVTESNVTIGDEINGSLDEVQIWRRALAQDQIQKAYENRTDIILASTTRPGDVWKAQVTPNDRTFDGQTVESNEVIIVQTGITNLTIEKTDSTDPVSAGNNLKYVITVRNLGELAAHNVTVQETYDKFIEFIGANPSPDAGTQNRNFTLGTIESGKSEQISIIVKVKNTAVNGSLLNNTATAFYQNTTSASFVKNATENTTVRSSILTSCGNVVNNLNVKSDILVEGTCFNVVNSSLTLNCSGFVITGNGSGFGINVTNVQNITIKDCKLRNFTTGVDNENVLNITLLRMNVTLSGTGMELRNVTKSLLNHTNISTVNMTLRYSNSAGSHITRLLTSSTTGGINILGSNNINLTRSTLLGSSGAAFNATSSRELLLENITARGYTIGVQAQNSNTTTLSSTTLRGSPALRLLQHQTATLFENDIGEYNFTSAADLSIRKPSVTIMEYLESVTAKGNNLSQDIVIATKSAFVDSAGSQGLNKSARITFFGVDFADPGVFRDANDNGVFQECPSNTCTEESYSVITNVFVFNVTQFTNYSVEETANICGVEINESTTLNKGFVDTGAANVCIDILADNVTFNCNGTVLLGNGSPTLRRTAIRVHGQKNVTIFNCTIINWYASIRGRNAPNLTIDENLITWEVLPSGGQNVSPWLLHASDNTQVTDNTVKLNRQGGTHSSVSDSFGVSMARNFIVHNGSIFMRVERSHNFSFINNTFIASLLTGTPDTTQGMVLTRLRDANFIGNQIETSKDDILLNFQRCNNTRFENNNWSDFTTSSLDSGGLYINGGDGTEIVNNTFNRRGTQALNEIVRFLDDGGFPTNVVLDNNTFRLLNLTSTFGADFAVFGSIINGRVRNNIFDNSTSKYPEGLSLGGTNNIFRNNQNGTFSISGSGHNFTENNVNRLQASTTTNVRIINNTLGPHREALEVTDSGTANITSNRIMGACDLDIVNTIMRFNNITSNASNTAFATSWNAVDLENRGQGGIIESNFIFSNNTDDENYALDVDREGLTIRNNTVRTFGSGIRTLSNNTLIENNRVTISDSFTTFNQPPTAILALDINVTVRNNTVIHFGRNGGRGIRFSTRTRIIDNNISILFGKGTGIWTGFVASQFGAEIINNTIVTKAAISTDIWGGTYGWGIDIFRMANSTVKGNKITLLNRTGGGIRARWGTSFPVFDAKYNFTILSNTIIGKNESQVGIVIENGNVTVANNTLYNMTQGIAATSTVSDAQSIINNIITNTHTAINLTTNSTTVRGNIINNASIGIGSFYASTRNVENEILQNTLTNITRHGISVSHTTTSLNNKRTNLISGNSITTSGTGVFLGPGRSSFSLLLTPKPNNTIVHNTISGATKGVYLFIANFTELRNNSFINNTVGILIGNLTGTGKQNGITVFNQSFTNVGTGIIVGNALDDSNRLINATFPSAVFEDVNNGRINYTGSVTARNIRLGQELSISSNAIFLNSTAEPGFNRTATLVLRGISNVAGPGRDANDDGSFNICPASICTGFTTAGTEASYAVSQFTTYNTLSQSLDLLIANTTAQSPEVAGNTITWTGTWDIDRNSSARLLIDDNLAFTDCNFTVQTGCIDYSAETTSTSATTNGFTVPLGPTPFVWYAQVCDALECDKLVFKPQNLTQTVLINESRIQMTLFGNQSFEYAGFGVAAGDVNNDGRADIIAGAPRHDAGTSDNGAVYVMFGTNNPQPLVTDVNPQNPDVLITGETQSFANLGREVASGDLNNDGIQDIIVSSDGVQNSRGRVYVIFGKGSLPSVVSLQNNEANFTLTGNTSFDELGADDSDDRGKPIATGDVNGDGITDLFVGALQADPRGQSSAGEAYIIYGSPNLQGFQNLNTTPANVTIRGNRSSDRLGRALAIGDINGDGIGDMILGAKDADPSGRFSAGQAYVYFGSTSLSSELDVSITNPNVTVSGNKSSDNLGVAVAAGDLNNDGIADLIVSAPGTDVPTSNSGSVLVFYGTTSWQTNLDLQNVEPNVTITGNSTGFSSDQLGDDLATGDFNGDGITDVLIGGAFTDFGGQTGSTAFIVYGNSTLPPRINAVVDPADVVLQGNTSGDNFGRSVAAGDINNDGKEEPIIGAYTADPGVSDAGAAYGIQLLQIQNATGNFTILETQLAIKTAQQDFAVPRSTANFTITVQNPFNFTLFNISVLEILPPEYKFENATPKPNSTDPQVWNFTSIPALQNETIEVVYRVNESAQDGEVLVNRVNVTATNGTALFNGSATASLTVQSRLVLNKTVDKSEASPGENVTFTINFRTFGNRTLFNVSIQDLLPTGLNFINASLQPNSTDPLTWNFTRINSTIAIQITFNATVNKTLNDGTVLLNLVNATALNSTGFRITEATARANVTVQQPPTVLNVTANPQVINQTQSSNITANVTDNTLVASVIANLTGPANFVLNTSNTTSIYNTTFITTLITPPGIYTVTIFATDGEGNLNNTETTTIEVRDVTPPSVKDLAAIPAVINLTNTVNLTGNVTDNTEISKVLINVTFPNGTTELLTATNLSDIYSALFTTSSTDPLGTYTVQFIANDTSNNINNTETTTLQIVENLPPAVINVTATPQVINQTNETIIRANVTDESGIGTVFANITSPDGSSEIIFMTNITQDIYNITFKTVLTTTPGVYNVLIVANDTLGNANNTETTNFTILDITNPEVFSLNCTPTAQQGGTITCTANVTDNSAVDTVLGNVTRPDGTTEQITMTNSSEFTGLVTNTQQTGTYTFQVLANDTSNNLNSTESTSFVITPAPQPPGGGGGGGSIRVRPPPQPAPPAPDVEQIAREMAESWLKVPPAPELPALTLWCPPVPRQNLNKTPVSCACILQGTTQASKMSAIPAAMQGKLPQGYELVTQPFTWNCDKDSIEFSLNLPDTYRDLQLFRCRNGECIRVEKAQQTDELICRGRPISELEKDTLLRKDIILPAEVKTLPPVRKIVTKENNTLTIGPATVKFTGFEVPFTATLSTPTEPVPAPHNPSLTTLSPPIKVSIDGLAKTTITYNISPGKNILQGTTGVWTPEDKVWRKQSEGTSWTTQRTEFTTALIGQECRACAGSTLKKEYDGGSKNAIVLVHGLLSSSQAWNSLLADIELTEQDWQVWTFEYPTNSTIDKAAEDLAHLLSQNANEYEQLILAGHSMGGLIVQQALRYSKEGKAPSAYLPKAKSAIVVGTPNKGSIGLQAYKHLLHYTGEHRTSIPFFNLDMPMLQEAIQGRTIPQVRGIKYYVIAGTRNYEFTVGVIEAKIVEEEKIDGLISTESARQVGDETVSNTCQNYFEINTTHTGLVDDVLPRKVLARIAAESFHEQAKPGMLGFNQYLHALVEECRADETYVVIGRKVPRAEVPKVSGCGCGDGICGVGESAENCPSDCQLLQLGVEKCTAINAGLYLLLIILLLLVGLIELRTHRMNADVPTIATATTWGIILASTALTVGSYIMCAFPLIPAIALAFCVLVLITEPVHKTPTLPEVPKSPLAWLTNKIERLKHNITKRRLAAHRKHLRQELKEVKKHLKPTKLNRLKSYIKKRKKQSLKNELEQEEKALDRLITMLGSRRSQPTPKPAARRSISSQIKQETKELDGFLDKARKIAKPPRESPIAEELENEGEELDKLLKNAKKKSRRK